MQNLLGRSREDVLSLASIRSVLARLEETIIFSLIERAQFAQNPRVYAKDGFKDVLHKDGFAGSWLDWFLLESESMCAKVRRYESPDEYPFTPQSSLPPPILPAQDYPIILHPASTKCINVNPSILAHYVDSIVPAITASHPLKDDQNYGSCATRDLEALQAISRRVHYGMFVAESKFLSAPSSFIPHIIKPNPEALLSLIVKPEVEAALLVRLRKKAELYGADWDVSGIVIASEKRKIDAEEVVRLYRDYLIPLTKDVEVDYLLRRLEGLSEAEISELKSTA